MSEGYRPAFYKDNPKLRSIDILKWAAEEKRQVFTLQQLVQRFKRQYEQIKDPVHDAAERIRRLRNSGMLMMVDEKQLSLLVNQGAMSDSEADEVLRLAHEIRSQRRGKAGRPPRVYRITGAGRNYVQKRMAKGK
jgi:hypothetical protein